MVRNKFCQRRDANRHRRVMMREAKYKATSNEAVRRALVTACLVMVLCGASSLQGFVTTHAQSGRTRPSDASAQQRARRVVVKPQASPTPASPTPTPDNSGVRATQLPPPPARSPANTTATQTASDAATDAANIGEIIEDDEVIDFRSNLVPVAASVIDPQGRAMVDLQLADFELQVDGQKKPISELHRSETPVRMVMLFDNSGSLTASRELEKQAALRFFKRVMRPIDQAALFAVATTVTIEQHLTSDVGRLTRTIERFPKPDGATQLFDAVALAAAYLKKLEGRKVIIIVSDGVDTLSDLTFDDVLGRAQEADCQIYAVQTGQSESANLRDLAAERRLQEFTAQTGGAVYTPRGTNDLDKAFEQIAADLSQQYVLSYYPGNEIADGRFRRINLRVVTRPNVRIRTRKGYYAPKG